MNLIGIRRINFILKSIIHTCRSGFVARVKLLLRYKADCSITNGKNELPIHRAASNDKNIEVR